MSWWQTKINNLKYNPKMVLRFTNRSQLKVGKHCYYIPFMKDNDIPAGTYGKIIEIESGDKVKGNNTPLLDDTRMIKIEAELADPKTFTTTIMNLSPVTPNLKRRRNRTEAAEVIDATSTFLGDRKTFPNKIRVIKKDPIFKEDLGCELLLSDRVSEIGENNYPYKIIAIKTAGEVLAGLTNFIPVYNTDCTKLKFINKTNKIKKFLLEDQFIYTSEEFKFTSKDDLDIEKYTDSIDKCYNEYNTIYKEIRYRKVFDEGLLTTYFLPEIEQLKDIKPLAFIVAQLGLRGEDYETNAAVSRIDEVIRTINHKARYTTYGGTVEISKVDSKTFTPALNELPGFKGMYERLSIKGVIIKMLTAFGVKILYQEWKNEY